MCILIIPDHDPLDLKAYPGDIHPGECQRNDIGELLRFHAGDPEAIRFIADMLEE